MIRAAFLAAALALPGLAAAQTVIQPAASAGDITAIQALIPQPASTVAPMETVTGSAGTAATFRRSDAAPVRISRAQIVTTVTGGTFSGTWTSAFPNNPALVLTPIVTGGSAVACELTAVPTMTTFQGRCWTASSTVALNLTVITAGLNLAPNAASPAGVQVLVTGVPLSQ